MAASDTYYPLGCGYTHAAFAVRKGNVPWPWQTQKPSARVGVSVWGRTSTSQSGRQRRVKLLRGCSAEAVVLSWPTVLCAGHGKKTVGETTWMQAALDQQLRNEPLLRPSSCPHCLGDGDESLFLSGTQIINKATSRFNANIYMAPIKCQVHARCGVLAGSL